MLYSDMLVDMNCLYCLLRFIVVGSFFCVCIGARLFLSLSLSLCVCVCLCVLCLVFCCHSVTNKDSYKETEL